MPEQENVFKTLFDEKFVQPVNRKFQAVDERIVQLEQSNATLHRCIWILVAFCLINLGIAIVAVYLCCK